MVDDQNVQFMVVPSQECTVVVGVSLSEDQEDILVTLDVDSAEELALQILGAVTLSSYFDIVAKGEVPAGEEN